MPDGTTKRSRAGQLLDILAREPRPAGSAAEAQAREQVRMSLAAHGFTTREEPFEYSAFPGRWATSLGGAAAIVILAVGGHLASRGEAWAALTVLVAGVAAVGLAALWLARRGVVDAPLMRRRSVNLIATRGKPTTWLMAHLDSKSQPVPILVRAGAISVGVIVWLFAITVAIAQGLGLIDSESWWAFITIAGVLTLLPVAASIVGARSDGAVDNASGCAAVVLAAMALPRDRAAGVILTSAEELGMAGARALARRWPAGRCINCDGLDDAGQWTVMYSGAAPKGLLAEVAAAADGLEMDVRPRRLLPGVLVDGVALADAGWQVVTISHGSLATLGRVHTRRDVAHTLEGAAIPHAAALMATIVNDAD